MFIDNVVNFGKLLVELGLNSLDELIEYMDECRRACEHSCDETDSLSRAERQAARVAELFGERVSSRDEWFSAWYDYEQEHSVNFSMD